MPPHAPSSTGAVESAALDPRLRLLLIGIRRALILIADALAEYCELPKRELQ
jgi:hypothetical protein